MWFRRLHHYPRARSTASTDMLAGYRQRRSVSGRSCAAERLNIPQITGIASLQGKAGRKSNGVSLRNTDIKTAFGKRLLNSTSPVPLFIAAVMAQIRSYSAASLRISAENRREGFGVG